MIVGRELTSLYEKQPVTPGEVLLEVSDLHAGDAKGVSFDLRKGEILGIGGLMGAGRTAVAHALAGMENITAGEGRSWGQAVWLGSTTAAKGQKGTGRGGDRGVSSGRSRVAAARYKKKTKL